MRLLLDTHALLWALLAPERLAPRATSSLEDPANDVLVSAATAWEIAIKQSLGKLVLPGPAEDWLRPACEETGLSWLAVDAEAALRVRALPWHHRDPFDRLLVAQASDEYHLVTRDPVFARYDISILRA